MGMIICGVSNHIPCWSLNLLHASSLYFILEEIKASDKRHLIQGLVQKQMAKTSHNLGTILGSF